jgi:CHAT domain-containing protein
MDLVSPDRLAAVLGDAALIEFFQLDGTLRGITVAGGAVRIRELGPTGRVRDLAARLPFALRRLADRRTGAVSRAAAVALLRHTAGCLDVLLLGPLSRELGDRPLVLVPTGPLRSLPWSILPSCAGRPVTVSPSASLWHLAARRPPRRTGRVAVAAGPDLPGARAEAKAVAAIHGTAPLVDTAATVEAVMAALDRTDVAHLAAHGLLRADNPLFSSLRLADGQLTVYDLERLERVPSTVVLAACDSARSIVPAGDELLGLGAAFLSHGTRQLVASVLPIPDAETAPLMVALHRRLAAGDPAAAALAGAQERMDREEPAVLAASAGFVCIGEGLRGAA